MKTEKIPIAVSEIPGEAMRFHVASRTRPKQPHLVDLLSNNGLSECSCADWQARRWPLIRDGFTENIRCKHVIAARTYFLDHLLVNMAAEIQQPRHRNAVPRAR